MDYTPLPLRALAMGTLQQHGAHATPQLMAWRHLDGCLEHCQTLLRAAHLPKAAPNHRRCPAGPIPTSFAGAPQLTFVDLSNNQFDGAPEGLRGCHVATHA